MRNSLLSRLVFIVSCSLLFQGCDAFTSVETRLERATEALHKGDYDLAAVESKAVLDDEPDNPTARLLLADASLKLGDLPTAERELQRAADSGVEQALLEPVRIEALLALGRPEAAKQALEDATTLSKNERSIFAGRIALADGKPAAALEAFDGVISAEPGSLEALVGKAEALIRLSENDGARRILSSIVESHPESGRAWFVLGGLDLRQARFREAADALQAAATHSAMLSVPERIQARAGRVEALLLAGDVDAAAAAQAELEEYARGVPATLLTAARVALAQGEAGRAVDLLQRVTNALPRSVAARALLVTALLERGSVEQALAEAGKLVGQFPEDDTARISLAQAQLRSGRPDDAQATLRPLVDRDRPSAQAVTLAAQIELRQGRSGAGVDFLERGVQATPADDSLKLQLAAAYMTTGRIADALALLESIPEERRSVQRDRLMVLAVAAEKGEASARSTIQKALEASPRDVALLNVAAAYLASLGDRRTARDYLDRALQVEPTDADSRVALARINLVEDKLAEAEQLATAVLERTPAHAGALGIMVEVSSRRGLSEETERWLQEARRASPAAVQPRLVLARRALVRGDMAAFATLVEEIEASIPDNAVVQYSLGDLFLEARQYAQATDRYQRATRMDPSRPEPYFGMARVHAAQGDLGAARTLLRESLKHRPGWLPAAQALARLEAAEGRIADALEIVADLTTRHAGDPAPWLLQGDLLLAARRPGEALRAFEAAHELQPSAAAIGRIYSARRMSGDGSPERVLVEWLERNPGDVQVRRLLANHYLTAGRNTEAIAEYEKLVTAAPDDAISLNNLAWLYSGQKDSRATEMARRAYELSPGNPSIADTYGWILIQSGESRKGLDIIEQVADKAKKNMEIQYHLAYGLHALGENDRALETLRQVLKNDSGASATIRRQAEDLARKIGGP